jgi:hypothetical protein
LVVENIYGQFDHGDTVVEWAVRKHSSVLQAVLYMKFGFLVRKNSFENNSRYYARRINTRMQADTY